MKTGYKVGLALAGAYLAARALGKPTLKLGVGNMVKVPVSKFVGANLEPLFSAKDIAFDQAKPVALRGLAQGADTQWDVQIAVTPADASAQGLILGFSMSPVEKKAFPVLFRASDVTSMSDAPRFDGQPSVN